ncbi:MAG TPA: DUF362 domain-containing protein [Anaerolineae bacterium]|nr:DUF362 domain-containing protein [Anaerolineae bacterium]
MIVVSNAGPIIALAKIGQLDLLSALYGEIIVPQAVYEEVVEKGRGRPGSQEVQVWTNCWVLVSGSARSCIGTLGSWLAKAQRMKCRVALLKGNDRYDNVHRALDLIADQIQVAGKQRVLIKPNFVSTRRQLAATHVDAVRALLDFLRARYDGPITIGEGPATSSAFEGYETFGYLALGEAYHVRFMDLNRDDWITAQAYDRRLRPMPMRVARTMVESDFRISIGPPKTHDTVIVTLSIKNMVMGSLISDLAARSNGRALRRVSRLMPRWIVHSPLAERAKGAVFSNRSDKMAMHQGYPAIHLNLYRLARLVYPHLAVIDGFVGMEGSGPTGGDPVDLGVAIASTDALAADAVATTIMGFDVDEVGYLHYCKRAGLGVGDLEQIEIVGNATIEECRRPFKPHPTYKEQLHWRLPAVEEYL